jgi:hypothetical protein
MGELGPLPGVASGDKKNQCLEARLLRARVERFMADFDCSGCATSTAQAVPTVAEVRSILRSRALRRRFMDERFCRDPSWDMLLELYATRMSGAPVTISSLCLVSPTSTTTALRWLSAFEEAGIAVRHSDSRDGRRVYLSLTDDAASAMDAYFRALPDFKGI